MYKNIVLFLVLLLTNNYCHSSNKDPNIYPVAVIGAGAGGTMAAKRASLHNCKTLLFTGAKKQRKQSRGHWVRKVDNIPGLTNYTRTINELRDETLALIANSPFSKKLNVIHDSVLSIEKKDDIFVIYDISGKIYKARHVVLATGIMDEQPHIKGSIKPILKFANKQFIAYCILCDGHRCMGKKTVIIGHSESAAQNALLLHNRYNLPSCSILTNGIKPSITQETLALLKQKNIKVIHEPIVSIVGDGKKGIFEGFSLASKKFVPAEFGFVNLGIRPNNALACSLGAKIDKIGLVKTDENGETSVSNLFVIGDLRSDSMKQIYTAWQHAVDVMQVIDRRERIILP